MSLFETVKNGQHYRQLCPKDKRLATTFQEINIIQLVELTQRFVPPIVVLLAVWQYLMQANLAITVISVLFALSLPLQGYYWLGKRATMPLTLNLLELFNRLQQHLRAQQLISEQPRQPHYQNLMILLKLNQQYNGDYYSGLEEDDHAAS